MSYDLDFEGREGRSAAIASKVEKSKILFNLFTAIVAAGLLATTSFSLRPLSVPVCIEGGEYAGYPVAFYIRCYGPLMPGGGQGNDDPEVRSISFARSQRLFFSASWTTVTVRPSSVAVAMPML